MSGGFFDYRDRSLEEIATSLEEAFSNDGKYIADDWGPTDSYGKRKQIEYDRLEGATEEQKQEILQEVKDLVEAIRNCQVKIHNFDMFLSGDSGFKTLLKK